MCKMISVSQTVQLCPSWSQLGNVLPLLFMDVANAFTWLWHRKTTSPSLIPPAKL